MQIKTTKKRKLLTILRFYDEHFSEVRLIGGEKEEQGGG